MHTFQSTIWLCYVFNIFEVLISTPLLIFIFSNKFKRKSMWKHIHSFTVWSEISLYQQMTLIFSLFQWWRKMSKLSKGRVLVCRVTWYLQVMIKSTWCFGSSMVLAIQFTGKSVFKAPTFVQIKIFLTFCRSVYRHQIPWLYIAP